MKTDEGTLREALKVLQIERQELGAILQLKKTCPKALARYSDRLARREKAAIVSFRKLPESGIKLVTGKQRIETSVDIYDKLQHEINDIQQLYDICGQQMADIQTELRKKPPIASQRSSAIFPTEK